MARRFGDCCACRAALFAASFWSTWWDKFSWDQRCVGVKLICWTKLKSDQGMSQNPVIHVLYRLYPLYQKWIPWHLAIWKISQQMDHSALPRLGNVHLMYELCHDVSWCVILSLLFLTKKRQITRCWDILRHVETKLPWAHGPRCPGSVSADVPWLPAPRPAPGAPAAGTAPRCRRAPGGRPRPTGRAPAARSRTRLGRWRPSPWCLWQGMLMMP